MEEEEGGYCVTSAFMMPLIELPEIMNIFTIYFKCERNLEGRVYLNTISIYIIQYTMQYSMYLSKILMQGDDVYVISTKKNKFLIRVITLVNLDKIW